MLEVYGIMALLVIWPAISIAIWVRRDRQLLRDMRRRNLKFTGLSIVYFGAFYLLTCGIGLYAIWVPDSALGRLLPNVPALVVYMVAMAGVAYLIARLTGLKIVERRDQPGRAPIVDDRKEATKL